MANHASAAKRHRQTIKRTSRNRIVRGSVRTALKKARTALSEGDKAKAESLVLEASKKLARAAGKGVIHARTAARKTSRITAQLAKLS